MGEQPAQVFLLGNLNFQPPKRKPISTYSEITESRITEDGMEPEPRTPKHRGLRSPAKLGRVGWNLVGEIAFHVFFLLLTFSFIILIAGVSYMNGRPVSNHDSRVLDQSTKMASTLFSSAFAAIIGRAAAKYASFQLERGGSIGNLEQLMPSRTMFGALLAQLRFKNLKLLGLLLMLIWPWSPIGSQAPLRLLSTRNVPIFSNTTIQYVDTMANDAFEAADAVTTILDSANIVYNAALIGTPATKNGTTDTFGNVKIPYMSKLRNKTLDGWRSVPISNDSTSLYSSLIGIPIAIPNAKETNFSLETTYISFDCTKPKTVAHIDTTYDQSSSNGTYRSFNVSDKACDSINVPQWEIALDVFVDEAFEAGGYPGQFIINNMTGIEASQGTLLFQSSTQTLLNGTTLYIISYCKVTQEYVESNVLCDMTQTGQHCGVVAQRPSRLVHTSSNITSLSFPTVFYEAGINWILATGCIARGDMSSQTQAYLQDPSASSVLAGQLVDLTNVSADELEDRLGQLLNTYPQAGHTGRILSSGSGSTGFSGGVRNAIAYMTNFEEVYVVSGGWLALFCIASFTMVSGAICSIWWSSHTRSPDILGYVSSLTRDSRYLHGPAASTMDGLDRAELLKERNIKIGVINRDSEDGLGMIVVSSPQEVTRPTRGAFYL